MKKDRKSPKELPNSPKFSDNEEQAPFEELETPGIKNRYTSLVTRTTHNFLQNPKT